MSGLGDRLPFMSHDATPSTGGGVAWAPRAADGAVANGTSGNGTDAAGETHRQGVPAAPVAGVSAAGSSTAVELCIVPPPRTAALAAFVALLRGLPAVTDVAVQDTEDAVQCRVAVTGGVNEALLGLLELPDTPVASLAVWSGVVFVTLADPAAHDDAGARPAGGVGPGGAAAPPAGDGSRPLPPDPERRAAPRDTLGPAEPPRAPGPAADQPHTAAAGNGDAPWARTGHVQHHPPAVPVPTGPPAPGGARLGEIVADIGDRWLMPIAVGLFLALLPVGLDIVHWLRDGPDQGPPPPPAVERRIPVAEAPAVEETPSPEPATPAATVVERGPEPPAAATAEPSPAPTPAATAVPPAATAPPPPPAPAPVPFVRYRVQAGDTLFSIARSFGVAVETLVAANNLPDNGRALQTGQELLIPRP